MNSENVLKYPLRPRIDDQRLKRPASFWGRRLSSQLRALPDFLIIGEMKSGTSSLFHYILRHPMVEPPLRKEVHFFTIGYQNGIQWYRSHFPLRRKLSEGRLTGEACPDYLIAPHAAHRIQRLFPEVRLIVLLRNPVERAVSHYHHEVRMGREYLPLMDALQVEEDRLATSDITQREGLETYLHASYKLRGRYAEHLETYLSIFDTSQILVIGNRELAEDPAVTTNKVFEFLGLAPVHDRSEFPIKNQGDGQSPQPSVSAYLTDYFDPHNQRLHQLLNRSIAW